MTPSTIIIAFTVLVLGALVLFNLKKTTAVINTPDKTDIAIDASKVERLRLIYTPSPLSDQDFEAFDFDSIVWEKITGNKWVIHSQISSEQFESNTDRHRFPSSIHSFDASTKTAIIQIGEGDSPRSSNKVQIIYSWRIWDIESNKEKEFLYTCQPNELFEPYKVKPTKPANKAQ